MTDSNENKPAQDWSKLAQEALDLWQNHLNGLANDPKVKEDMARMVAPMGQMFTQWTSMMQTGMQNMAPFMAGAEQPSAEGQTEEQGDGTTCEDETMTQSQPSDMPEAVEPQGAASNAEEATGTTTDDTDGGLDVPDVVAQDTPTDTQTEIPTAVADVIPTVAVAAPAATATAATTTPAPQSQPAVRGRAPATDGTRDLAQLASRLAELERELDSLRPKKRAAGDAESASDSADDSDVQRVAGANKRSTSV